MKQIFNFCGKYLNEKKGILTLYILICIFGSMTTVVFPYISGSFIDRLVQATDTSFLGRYILIFALFSIVGLILGYVSSRLYMKLQTQIAFRLNADAIKHVQNVPLSFILCQDTAYLNHMNARIASLTAPVRVDVPFGIFGWTTKYESPWSAVFKRSIGVM